MSKISFENYQRAAEILDDNIEVAGRYSFQKEAERRILFDLLEKLDIKVTDSLLEIGCGPGNLLVPLSGFCSKVAGIDNEAAISRLKNRMPKDIELSCLIGNFLDMNLPNESFNKILIYSVLQYLSNQSEVLNFVERALSILNPGGRMLLGDLPNSSKKSRFINSKTGQDVSIIWNKMTKYAERIPNEKMQDDTDLVTFDDSLVFELMAFIRDKGFEAFLLSQPLELPFGGTREDILIVAHR